MERMDEFFARRVDIYDEHMRTEVPGCPEGCRRMAELLPEGVETLLDLGCGTGLELESIFARLPRLRVTGVDLTRAMLDRLREKFPDRALELVCGSYVGRDFGTERYDAAVSCETLHHLEPETKAALYRRLWEALWPGGVYLECDFMVCTEAEEADLRAENRRLRAEQGVGPEEFYHFDIPCTEEHNRLLLLEAGFSKVETAYRLSDTVKPGYQEGDTVLLAAWK